MDWIQYTDQKPEPNQKVIYFFEVVGVHRGVYHGDGAFSSKRGWLQDDVTHWMPDEGQEMPLRPFATLDVLFNEHDEPVYIGYWDVIRNKKAELKKEANVEDLKITSENVDVPLFYEYLDHSDNGTIDSMEAITLSKFPDFMLTFV